MKTYRYRPHIAWLRPVIPALLVLLTVWFVGLSISTNFPAIGIVFGIIMLGEAWVIWHILGRFVKVEVTLGDDRIVYHGKKGTIEIPYEQITRLRFPSVRYLGGWLKIVSESGTIRLTVVVEDIGQFIRELKDQLDRRSLSAKYDRARLFRFYKTAEYSDQAWARIHENSGNAVAALLLAAAAGWLASLVMKEILTPFFTTVVWVLLAVAWALLVYVFAEIELVRRLARDSDEESFSVPERNPRAERILFVKAFGAGGIFFAAGVVLMALLGS